MPPTNKRSSARQTAEQAAARQTSTDTVVETPEPEAAPPQPPPQAAAAPAPAPPLAPYNASKAGGDHAVRAYHHAYGLPVTITNCANNYGPYQFPEKVLPLFITRALNDEPLPVMLAVLVVPEFAAIVVLSAMRSPLSKMLSVPFPLSPTVSSGDPITSPPAATARSPEPPLVVAICRSD